MEDACKPAVAAELLRTVTARFCQAVADLEALGYVKRSGRRSGKVLLRSAFQLEADAGL
jgi:hypothetical protein